MLETGDIICLSLLSMEALYFAVSDVDKPELIVNSWTLCYEASSNPFLRERTSASTFVRTPRSSNFL